MKRCHHLCQLLSEQSPEATSLVFFAQGNKIHWSYKDLLKNIEDFPLPKARCVGIFASTTAEAIVSIFALAGKRRIVLLDPDSELSTLVAQIQKTHIGALLGDDGLAAELHEYLDVDYQCSDVDILFFTSGTTSKAKAVMLSEESLCAAAYNGGSLLPLRPEDTLLSVLPYSHVFGFVCALLWPLSFGCAVCLGRGMRSIFFDFGEYHPTVASLVPQMAGFLAAKKLFNPELRLILIGAGTCDSAVLNLIRSQGIQVSFGYGLTETSSGVALSLGDDPYAMSVCPDYQIEIAADGEIVLHGGPTFMKGYYDDDESTANVLHDGALYTGDLGKVENGLLYITGRKKEILVFNDGTKLFLPEFEGDLRKILGQDADFAVLQGKDGSIILYIHKPTGIEEQIEKFNLAYPRSHRVAKIIYAPSPLPRTKTGKVQRYLITTD